MALAVVAVGGLACVAYALRRRKYRGLRDEEQPEARVSDVAGTLRPGEVEL